MTVFEKMDLMGYTVREDYNDSFYKRYSNVKLCIVFNYKTGVAKGFLAPTDLIMTRVDIKELDRRWVELMADLSELANEGVIIDWPYDKKTVDK